MLRKIEIERKVAIEEEEEEEEKMSEIKEAILRKILSYPVVNEHKQNGHKCHGLVRKLCKIMSIYRKVY